MAKEKKSKGRKIIYLGDDRSYWDNIKSRFLKTYNQTEFDFLKIHQEDPTKYQEVFLEILDIKPTIIYIDFSEDLNTQLKLAQLVRRDNSTAHIPIVGLVESQKDVRDCLTAGVPFIHIKCAEFHDVVYDPYFWAFPKEAKAAEYAKAKFSREAELIDDFRIGYITPTDIHAEGNIKLQKGEKIKLESAIPEKIIPSKNFIVKEIYTSNLYYDYTYGYDLEFVFVDEPEVDENENEDVLGEEDEKKRLKKINDAKMNRRQKLAEYEDHLQRTKKKQKKWVLDNMYDSSPKQTKILIVDEKMRVLRNEDKPIDQHGYTIRTQTLLSGEMSEIDRMVPNIIAFQYVGDDEVRSEEGEAEGEQEELSEEELKAKEEAIREAEKRANEQLVKIIAKIKSIQNYKPFLIIFNCRHYTSKSFQDTFKYPWVITNKGRMKLKIILDMAEMYEKKQKLIYDEKVNKRIEEMRKKDPQKYGRLTPKDFEEERFYVSKDHDLSHISCSYPIELETLTESEITFLTEEDLDLKTFRLNFPVQMSITLVEQDGKKFQLVNGKNQYKALIHSIGETEKKKLRRFINEIFFGPLMEERKKEEDAFREVNEKVMQERLEAALKNMEGEDEDDKDDGKKEKKANNAAPEEE